MRALTLLLLQPKYDEFLDWVASSNCVVQLALCTVTNDRGFLCDNAFIQRLGRASRVTMRNEVLSDCHGVVGSGVGTVFVAGEDGRPVSMFTPSS